MIAVCQNVALSAEDKLLVRHQLRKHKILMKIFPNQVGSSPLVWVPGFPCPLPIRPRRPSPLHKPPSSSLAPKLQLGAEETVGLHPRHDLACDQATGPQ